jgi:hypothetical protein
MSGSPETIAHLCEVMLVVFTLTISIVIKQSCRVTGNDSYWDYSV